MKDLLPVYVCEYQKESEGRWFIATDMNCDSVFTISDVGLWAHWGYFLPGDFLLWGLMQIPQVATFLELTPDVYSGWFSGIVSGLAWIMLLFIFDSL